MSTPPPLVSFTNITSNEDYQNENANTSSFQNMKPSILIILLILSITILLCISLCLLFGHLNHRLLQRLPPSTTATATATTSSSSSNCNSRISPEFYSVVDSLPLFTFSSIKHRSSSSSGDCAVCLSSFEPHDQLRLLPLCCHGFHSQCIDSWLVNNQTCPLCRSSICFSDFDIMKATLQSSATNGGGGVPRADSFRLQIGSISRRQDTTLERNGTSYTIGGFDYIVDEEAEVNVSSTQRRIVSEKAENETTQNLAADIASPGNGGWNWLKDYVDRLSSSLSASTSRAMSFRGSGRFFAGSSRRTEAFAGVGDYDIEQAGRVGEEISELFRWLSGV